MNTIMNKKRIIIGTSIFLVTVIGVCAAGTAFIYNKAKSNINYTSDQAKEIALGVVKGDVLKVNKKLELEHGSFEYDFKIRDTNNILISVTVDATLGAVTDIDNYYD